jgi:hypothetical protein
MAGVGRKLTFAELAGRLAAKAAGLPGLVRQYLDAAGVLCASELKRDLADGRSPDGTPFKPLAHPRPNSKGGDQPLRDTGLLGASLGGGPGHVRRVTERSLTIGTNVAHAKTHQDGAVIVPVKAKYLAIPLTPAASKAGSPRNYPGDLVGVYGKKGGVLLDDATDQPQYALTKGPVVIPPRPFIGFSQALIGKLKKLAVAVFGGGPAKG